MPLSWVSVQEHGHGPSVPAVPGGTAPSICSTRGERTRWSPGLGGCAPQQRWGSLPGAAASAGPAHTGTLLTGTLLTSRPSCSPQVTPGACSKLRAGAAGPGRRKAPGWGLSSGLGLSLPGGLCLCTPCMDTRTPTLGSPQDSALPHLSPSLARTGSSPWGIRGPGKVLAPQHQGGESQPGPSFAAVGSCPQPSPSHLQTQLRTPQDGPQCVLSDRSDLGSPIPALPQNWEE